ncbi:MAG TPA: choice-of-anchor Q domain-containing protein [Candidatus Binatia bacterium]
MLLGSFLSASSYAAVFTVNSVSDISDANPGNGVCETGPGNGTCTLRAAIQESNASAGTDEIVLPPNTYVLTIVSQLSITDSLTITGSAASTTIIDGNKSARPNGRVLVISSGITVNISGVTIRNGGTTDVGGGIFNGGTLTLTNSILSANNADESGGGIYNTTGATAMLANITVSGNNVGEDGGGIFNLGALMLTNSTVTGNSAGDDAGGVFNVTGGTAMLANITVSGNNAGDGGGGVRNSGTLTLTNSTVSGNNAGGNGGGIYNFLGTVNSFSSTITNNRSDVGLHGTGVGGGIHNDAAATFTFRNTILAGNFETQRVGNVFVATTGECDGTISSSGNNLMKSYDPSHCTVIGSPLLADPILGPLQDNGGTTQTHALLAGSPAIDAGSPSGCLGSTGAPLPTDQRGFPRSTDGNGDGAAMCDIGAFEASGQNVVPMVSVNDVTVSEGNSGTVTATFQVTLSAATSQPVTVTFATGGGTATGDTDYVPTSGTITFNPGETSKPITVAVIGDTVVEGNETFFVTVTSATNATIAHGQGIGTILDDDGPHDVRLGNISTRSRVLTGDNVMVGGFIIDGVTPLRVLVRSRGPSLGGAPFLVSGTLANPSLRLFSGQNVIAQNDNWQDAPNCSGGFFCEGAAQIAKTGLDPCQPNTGQAGAPPNCILESAILITLPPGAYTAVATGANGETGVALVEVFEVDDAVEAELSNISTRSFVQTGDNVMIGGLIIEGNAPATILIRARGPSMSGAPFFVPGTLPDPFLQLFSGQNVIAQNNNWQDSPSCGGLVCGNAAQIAASRLDPCQPNPGQTTSPPNCGQESSILITLPPGAYTAIVSGVGGGTGVGLVEAFQIE